MKFIIFFLALSLQTISAGVVSPTETLNKAIDKQCKEKMTGELYVEGSESEVFLPSGGWTKNGKWSASSLLENNLMDKYHFKRLVYSCNNSTEITITKINENYSAVLTENGKNTLETGIVKGDNTWSKIKNHELSYAQVEYKQEQKNKRSPSSAATTNKEIDPNIE